MSGEPDIAVPARIIGEPARARILVALLGDRALPAGECARLAGVSASTASEHLAAMADAGLITVERGGRRRYVRLAGADVARAIEALQAIAPATEVRSLRQDRVSRALREGRTCYDHLAGDLGLQLTEVLHRHGLIDDLDIGSTGAAPVPFPSDGVAHTLGLRPPTGRRPWSRGCLDWTGRRPHAAGQVGAQVLRTFREQRWLVQPAGSRAVRLTAAGEQTMVGLGI